MSASDEFCRKSKSYFMTGNMLILMKEALGLRYLLWVILEKLKWLENSLRWTLGLAMSVTVLEFC